jgi:hypothetical protein
MSERTDSSELYSERARAVDMDPANDFPELPEDARPVRPRGYIYLRSRNPSNVAEIDGDLQELFPTERAVNDALRLFLTGMPRPQPVAEAREGGRSREEREQTGDYDRPLPIVVIHQDLHPFFPDPEAVNRALRAAAGLVHQVDARRVG